MEDSTGSGLADGPGHLSAFQKLIGWKVEVWEEGYAVITCRIRPDFMNRGGVLHGGLIATLLDSVAGHAAFGVPPSDPSEPRRGGVTLSFTINYLGTAHDGVLTVTGRRTGGGRSIIFARAEVVDAAGNLIAEGSGTFKRRKAQG